MTPPSLRACSLVALISACAGSKHGDGQVASRPVDVVSPAPSTSASVSSTPGAVVFGGVTNGSYGRYADATVELLGTPTPDAGVGNALVLTIEFGVGAAHGFTKIVATLRNAQGVKYAEAVGGGYHVPLDTASLRPLLLRVLEALQADLDSRDPRFPNALVPLEERLRH